MIVTSIHTTPVKSGDQLIPLFDVHIKTFQEESILVITSKIISITQGRTKTHKQVVDTSDLIADESSHYIEPSNSKYGITLSITRNTLIPNAGIDESNGNGEYILWPENPFEVASTVWQYLKKRFSLTHVGVLITDSTTSPMRWGTRGVGLSWCGFEPLNSYIGTPDIFGRPLHATKASIIDGLAAAAVVVMGEGNEQTPMATIQDVPFVRFTDMPPVQNEIDSLLIDPIDDLYAPLITAVSWKKGKK